MLLTACTLRGPAGRHPPPPAPAPRIDASTASTSTPQAPGAPTPESGRDGLLAAELVTALATATAPGRTEAPDQAAAVPSGTTATQAASPSAPSGYVLEDPALPGPALTAADAELSPVLISQRAEMAARWNLGGASRDDHPTHGSSYHPGTRVVVDVEVAGTFGAAVKPAMLRKQTEARARARGYWPLRACYEASWRAGLDEPTDHTIRATILGSGRVQATRILKSDGPDALGPCLSRALKELDLGSLPARRVDADLRMRFWPGDAPLPRDARPTDGACADAHAVRPLREATDAWRSRTAALNACVEPALARDPTLWGRLELRARFEPSGRAGEVTQFQTTFPDAAVVECVKHVIEDIAIEPGPCPADLIFALRVGEPRIE